MIFKVFRVEGLNGVSVVLLFGLVVGFLDIGELSVSIVVVEDNYQDDEGEEDEEMENVDEYLY